ncbi:MAG: DUF6458 family protein [Nocardioidaceae bacterium]
MGIGIGIVLLVIGLIIEFALNFSSSVVDSQALGWILIAVGILAIILALIMNAQRSTTKHVEERRYNDRG